MTDKALSVEVVEPLDNTNITIDISKTFDEQVVYYKRLLIESRKRDIKAIWAIGSFVNLLKENSAYGDHTVDNFVEKMGDIQVKTKEVYKWGTFASRYTLQQLNTLLSKCDSVSWHVVSNLARIEETDVRAMLEDSLASGETKPGQVQEAVSALKKRLQENAAKTEEAGEGDKKPEAPSIPKINNCLVGFRKMNNITKLVLTNREKCVIDIQDLSLIIDNEAKHEKAVNEMGKFLLDVQSAIDVLQELQGMLDKTI